MGSWVNFAANDKKLVQTLNQECLWAILTYYDSKGFGWSTYHWCCSEAMVHCLHAESEQKKAFST